MHYLLGLSFNREALSYFGARILITHYPFYTRYAHRFDNRYIRENKYTKLVTAPDAKIAFFYTRAAFIKKEKMTENIVRKLLLSCC